MNHSDAGIKDYLKSFPFYFLPHHFMSRIVYRLTRMKSSKLPFVIKQFSKKFKVNLSEALIQDVTQFKTFNEFFTRELKPDARLIAEGENILTCPVDGTISQFGEISNDRIFQAKGHDYSALELLGGDSDLARPFENGQFCNIYLSPRDYHRIHMPCDGTLTHQIHVPGRLFSVAPFTVKTVPRVFARNERVVALFDTPFGKMAMVLVGAMNVAAIETVWDGLVTPPKGKTISTRTYADNEVTLGKGEEMGRFNMGSTVILLLENNNLEWDAVLEPEKTVRLGMSIGST
jgi:phosphatidylserine decarboxylase